jgi:hypothetical protein
MRRLNYPLEFALRLSNSPAFFLERVRDFLQKAKMRSFLDSFYLRNSSVYYENNNLTIYAPPMNPNTLPCHHAWTYKIQQ